MATKQQEQGTKAWYCTVDQMANSACRREHHRRATNPNRRAQGLIPAGHDLCGWVLVPKTVDKAFKDAEKEWWKAK